MRHAGALEREHVPERAEARPRPTPPPQPQPTAEQRPRSIACRHAPDSGDPQCRQRPALDGCVRAEQRRLRRGAAAHSPWIPHCDGRSSRRCSSRVISAILCMSPVGVSRYPLQVGLGRGVAVDAGDAALPTVDELVVDVCSSRAIGGRAASSRSSRSRRTARSGLPVTGELPRAVRRRGSVDLPIEARNADRGGQLDRRQALAVRSRTRARRGCTSARPRRAAMITRVSRWASRSGGEQPRRCRAGGASPRSGRPGSARRRAERGRGRGCRRARSPSNAPQNARVAARRRGRASTPRGAGGTGGTRRRGGRRSRTPRSAVGEHLVGRRAGGSRGATGAASTALASHHLDAIVDREPGGRAARRAHRRRR